MSNYRRVLPRDLFNEASLLKCIGRLVIVLEDKARDGNASFAQEDVDAFDIIQHEDSGGIEVRNLDFMIGGIRHPLVRPLNSRRPYPLYVEAPEGDFDFDEVAVFDDEGELTPEMCALIGLPELD